MEKIPLTDSAFLMRETLGSINLPEKETINKERPQDSEMFYSKHFKEIINRMIQDQMEFIATKTDTPEQFLFGRGTMNGLLLVREWFEREINISLSRFENQKNEDVVDSSTFTGLN